jgi:hypothetical protein
MNAMPLPAKLIIGGILLCVPVLLALAALPRFSQGLRIEPASNALATITLGQPLPLSSYKVAAAAYDGTPDSDGADLTELAEFSALAAGDDAEKLLALRPLAVRALAHDPLNPRAWNTLCTIETKVSPSAAVDCLDRALAIVPYDWFTAPQRMSLVAHEWPFLDEKLRNRAVSLIEPMWNSAKWSNMMSLRGELFILSLSPEGRQLLRAGLTRDSLRDFNRFIIEERVYGG